MPKFFTFSGFFSKICARAHGARGGQYRSCRAPRANPSRRSLLPSPARSFAAADGLRALSSLPPPEPRRAARHPPPRQGLGKWVAYLVARHDLAIHALDPLELSDEVPEFALRAHLWTRRLTLASARGDRRSARAFSPRCAACQTTGMPSVSPASPCTPAPARAPAGSAARLPAPLR